MGLCENISKWFKIKISNFINLENLEVNETEILKMIERQMFLKIAVSITFGDQLKKYLKYDM